ncbi:hypothetical protein SRHO_G00083370 [Serrasalmus rhombeus]
MLFMKTVELANDLVQSGVTINGLLTLVMPLSIPSIKIILSKVDRNAEAPVRAKPERPEPVAAGPVLVVPPAAAACLASAQPLANLEPEGGEPSVLESAAEEVVGAE